MAYASEHAYPPRYYPYAPLSPPPPASYPPPYSHHQHHHHNPPPPLHAAPAAAAAAPDQQHINTLFIAGLPNDVKPREIHNLFCRRQGFQTCQLEYTGRGDQVVAFATFHYHHSAMAALNELNGAIFDPQTGSTLHVELARSNSRKRPRGGGAYAVIDRRAKVTNVDQETSSNDGDEGSNEPEGTGNDNSSNKGASQSGEIAENIQAASNGQPGDVPPCSTLFIANLGPTCTEEELKQVLSTYDGFQTLKVRGKSGMPVAFADFKDVKSATEAMNKLQDTTLESSDRGGMHIEYARSKMRKA